MSKTFEVQRREEEESVRMERRVWTGKNSLPQTGETLGKKGCRHRMQGKNWMMGKNPPLDS